MKKLIIAFFFIFSSTIIFAQSKPDALKEYNNGNYQKSIEICMQEISIMPQNTDSYIVLCWSLIKLEKYSEALLYAQKASSFAKTDIRVIGNLAEAYFYVGKNEESLKLFQQYILAAPEGARISEAFALMGEIYIRSEDYNHADIALTTACQFNQTNALYWARLGYAREQAKDYQYALMAYKQALKLNPKFNDASLGIARINRILGN